MSIFDGFSAQEREILQARAQRVAQVALDEAHEVPVVALAVTVGKESYALPIETIANVYEGVALTPVPCAPSCVTGVANIRGRILLVLDLATLLGIAHESSIEAVTLAVLADGDLGAAFQVEGIRGVEALPAGDLAAVPPNMDLRHADYIQGILPDGTVLLDVSAILNDPELIVKTDSL